MDILISWVIWIINYPYLSRYLWASLLLSHWQQLRFMWSLCC